MKIYLAIIIFIVSSTLYSNEERIIYITQVPCQFLELESKLPSKLIPDYELIVEE